MRWMFVMLLLLASCTPVEEGKGTEVYFCPRDDCGRVFEDNLQEANETVVCAFYELELESLINGIRETDAKLAIDEDNFRKDSYLYDGINAKGVKSRSIMHNKFCVIDEKIVITGSFNPTYRGNFKNNNNIVVLYSRYIAKNYLDEFNELWQDKRDKKVKHPKVFLNNNTVENYFCPEDCEGRIVPLLESAEESIYFMTFSFTRDDMGQALFNAHQKGLDVKGVCEKSQNNKWHEFEKLKGSGIDVKWDNNPANMHHKVFVIDNKTVVTGSMNPSKNGLERNDENVLILHNERIAKEFLEEFECVCGVGDN